MAETLQQFIAQNQGKCLDFDGVYGCQCMDLALFWERNLGKALITAPSAVQTWSENPPGYTKVPMGRGTPQPGDLIIWGQALDPYGHIAIFISLHGAGFDSFDQNWVNTSSHGSPGAVVYHTSWFGVLGWFHPIVGAPPAPRPATPPPPNVQVNGVNVKGKVFRPSEWRNWTDLADVGHQCAAGTLVSYTDAKRVGGVWWDRIMGPHGPGSWCLKDDDIDTGGKNPSNFGTPKPL